MSSQETQTHWDEVYSRRASDQVSWYEASPTHSLDYIAAANPNPAAPLIDIGGGASVLVDRLLDLGFSDVTVLDVSQKALDLVGGRMGAKQAKVTLLRQDVTSFRPARRYALWHDRAVFHFLTEQSARRQYVEALTNSTSPGSHVVMATFGPEGPLRCSSLEICRYDATTLSAEMGGAFRLIQSSLVTHRTPSGTDQHFLYTLFRRQ